VPLSKTFFGITNRNKGGQVQKNKNPYTKLPTGHPAWKSSGLACETGVVNKGKKGVMAESSGKSKTKLGGPKEGGVGGQSFVKGVGGLKPILESTGRWGKKRSVDGFGRWGVPAIKVQKKRQKKRRTNYSKKKIQVLRTGVSQFLKGLIGGFRNERVV